MVGSGPNGLAAALTLARAGLGVEVYEASDDAGGGCRTEELTLPGFHHDVCSTVHPLLAASPFFRQLDLDALGVTLRMPPVAFAHPLDGGRAAAVVGSVDETARATRTRCDGVPPVGRPARHAHARSVIDTTLSPIRSLPSDPLVMGRFARSWAAVGSSTVAALRVRRGAGADRRRRRALDDAAERAAHRCIRPCDAAHRARRRVAGRRRRERVDRRWRSSSELQSLGGELITGRSCALARGAPTESSRAPRRRHPPVERARRSPS